MKLTQIEKKKKRRQTQRLSICHYFIISIPSMHRNVWLTRSCKIYAHKIIIKDIQIVKMGPMSVMSYCVPKRLGKSFIAHSMYDCLFEPS